MPQGLSRERARRYKALVTCALRRLLPAALLALAACSGSTQGCPPCPAAETCLEAGKCALACAADAGNPCPAGQTCQRTTAYCQGTGCTPALVWVCLP